MRKKKSIIHRFYAESLSKLWQAIDQVCYTVKHVVRVAKMVGADMNLVKAGGRFHEIGKLKSNNYVSAGLDIMKANNLFTDDVTVGQIILIPNRI